MWLAHSARVGSPARSLRIVVAHRCGPDSSGAQDRAPHNPADSVGGLARAPEGLTNLGEWNCLNLGPSGMPVA